MEECFDARITTPSKSPYVALIVSRRKKDGSYHICIDYRELNQIIIKNKFPIPLIDDLRTSYTVSKFFSNIDLYLGYYHIPVWLQDEEKIVS
jgi:hypothetical protein